MNDVTMGNQQETVENICWLAGAFDADGTVTIRNPKEGNAAPYLDLSNTDDSFIDKSVSVIQSLGINPYISEQKLNKNWKKVYRVRVHRAAHVKLLLEKLLPYLTAKKSRASLVLKYINNKDIRLIADVKELNKRGTTDSSETIC